MRKSFKYLSSAFCYHAPYIFHAGEIHTENTQVSDRFEEQRDEREALQ